MAVWDCFLFNDEHALLEVRLTELSDVVDHFVVVEAPLTFTGLSKPLHFAEHAERYARWAHKIRHVVADLPLEADSPWDREHAQHAAMRGALAGAAPDDLVLLGDVDELPRREVVAWLADHLEEPTRLLMHWAIFRANWLLPTPWDEATMACRVRDFGHPMVRLLLGDDHGRWDGYSELILRDAGVHISYPGDAEALRRKLAAYSHQEKNTPRDNDPAHLDRCLRYGVHFEGRHVLRRLDVRDLPPQLARVHAVAPGLFDAGRSPSPRAAVAFCTWVWLRRNPRLPDAVVRVFDRRPWLVTGPLAPLFLVLAGLLRRRRRRNSPSWTWKRPRFVDAPPPALPDAA